MLDEIRRELRKHLSALLPEAEIEFMRPPQWGMGQIGVPLFQVAKQKKINPGTLAQELERKLKPPDLPPGVRSAQAFGPYLNFFLDWTWVGEQLRQTPARCFSPMARQERSPVVVEYSSPNLAKPLGIHHLRSTMIGQVLSNLYDHSGQKVIRYNYLGDMGSSFGQLCVGLEKTHGKDWKTRSYSLDELYQAYTAYQAHAKNDDWAKAAPAYTQALEAKAPELLPLHQRVVQVTRQALESIYQQLGVSFDVWDGEFTYANQAKQVLALLKPVKEAQVKESEGAQVLFFKDEVLPSSILVKSDGTTVYLARDFLTAEARRKTYQPEKLIYVVGSEQTLHLKQLKFVMDRVWGAQGVQNPPEVIHVPYGLMSIEGLKMSTRQGRVLLLEDVIAEGTEEMLKRMGQHVALKDVESKARQLAVGAIIFSDLFHSIAKNVTFRWEDILNVEGDTGPYIFYAYARLSGILRKMNLHHSSIVTPQQLVLSEHDDVLFQVLFGMLEYPDAVRQSIQGNDPSHFARYLLSFAKNANAFYHAYPVKDEPDPHRQQLLLWMLKLIQETLEAGARLLNIRLLDAL